MSLKNYLININKKNLFWILLLITLGIILFLGYILYSKNSYLKSFNLVQESISPSILNLPKASAFNLPPPTLESIFNPDHSWVNQLPQDKIFTLITTGDVIPARTVNYKMTVYNNFQYPFEKTADFLKTANLTLINLESPLIKDCPITNEGMIFCGNQRFIEGLKYADVDVVNLANNHSFNYGQNGLVQTTVLLINNGILTSGISNNNLAIKQFNHYQIGFLGWNLLDKVEESEIIKIIKEAKAKVDLLTVSLHWGAEYVDKPTLEQKNLAHQIIEAGADLIVGNHAHWLQPIEIYNDKLIIYAQGNFIFDQGWSRETKTGFLAKHTFYNKKLIDIEIFPIFITDYSQPQLLTGQDKDNVLKTLQNISKKNQLL